MAKKISAGERIATQMCCVGIRDLRDSFGPTAKHANYMARRIDAAVRIAVKAERSKIHNLAVEISGIKNQTFSPTAKLHKVKGQCEGCPAKATTTDSVWVPLCKACYAAMMREGDYGKPVNGKRANGGGGG